MTGLPDPRPCALHYADGVGASGPFEVAVVTPTLLRPEIVEAVESVFAQQGVTSIQLLIGIDHARNSLAALDAALRRRPLHVSALVVALPYSTSERRGGVHPPHDGGSLRSILSFMAHSRFVAYLDDDNAWEPDHLRGLLDAVQGKAWAHAQRLLVDETTGVELAVDRWDSVGVGRGRFAAQGGMVDPNCLLVDKLACVAALGQWSEGPGWKADRAFFGAIKDLPHGRVERPTVRYRLHDPHAIRELIRDGVEYP